MKNAAMMKRLITFLTATVILTVAILIGTKSQKKDITYYYFSPEFGLLTNKGHNIFFDTYETNVRIDDNWTFTEWSYRTAGTDSIVIDFILKYTGDGYPGFSARHTEDITFGLYDAGNRKIATGFTWDRPSDEDKTFSFIGVFKTAEHGSAFTFKTSFSTPYKFILTDGKEGTSDIHELGTVFDAGRGLYVIAKDSELDGIHGCLVTGMTDESVFSDMNFATVPIPIMTDGTEFKEEPVQSEHNAMVFFFPADINEIAEFQFYGYCPVTALELIPLTEASIGKAFTMPECDYTVTVLDFKSESTEDGNMFEITLDFSPELIGVNAATPWLSGDGPTYERHLTTHTTLTTGQTVKVYKNDEPTKITSLDIIDNNVPIEFIASKTV